MKFRSTFRTWIILFLSCSAGGYCMAQEASPAIKVKYKTVMENYAPEIVVPVDERRRLKKQRYQLVRTREVAIDTLDISDRKKRRLLKELYRTPFTDEYEKVLGNLRPEDPLADRPD